MSKEFSIGAIYHLKMWLFVPYKVYIIYYVDIRNLQEENKYYTI